jgi:multidrug resistance efflux pump
MSTAFSRTLRLIESDCGRGATLGLLGTGLLLAGWTVWAATSRVTLYETTSNARLEVDRAVYPIQANMAGRVTRTWLTVGDEVRAGDPLVELDASAQRLQLSEENSRLEAVAPEMEALRRQIAAEERARDEERQAASVAADEARANARQAEVPAAYQAAEIERLRQLHSEGLMSERDYQKGLADARQSRSAADRDGIAVHRVEREQVTRESDRGARIRALEAETIKLDAQATIGRSAARRLQNEIDRRVLRAPVSGRLGEAAPLRAGSVVSEGEKIGAIIPDGRLIVVAQFAPPDALGRIRPGQHAQLRLDGFPWTQYGAVQAEVTRVASEVRDGAVRVELAVDTSQPARIPLQHGLPGSLEVAVERVSPAALALRTSGGLLTSSRKSQ